MTARDDRSSALLVALPFGRIFPETDGAIGALDRQQLGLLYRPIPVDAPLPVTPDAVINGTTIDNWYVTDYRTMRPRRISTAEYAFLRQLFAVWKRSQRDTRAAARLHRTLERKFSANVVPRRPRRTVRDLYARRI